LGLAEQLSEDMKAALKAGDKMRLGALRTAHAAVKQQEVDTRTVLTDADVIRVIEKLIKRGRDAESQFRAGGRTEQADKEAAEIAILGAYLPAQLDESELNRLIDEIISSTGATSMRDMGEVMAALRARAGGQVDMARANRRIQDLLRHN
jgi:uncharacterized protein YqeY